MSDQLKLPLIPHAIEGEIVTQRQMDGYINATAMCTAAGKKFSHYLENKTTQAFIDALASDAGIPVSELIQMVTGGAPHLRGSWVHPQVAINLAQWLSPKFAVQVTKWVYDWLSGGKKQEAGLPYHLRRYVKNMGNVPDGHFSVLTEMTLALIAPLEMVGYKLPEKLWPDISQGKMFAKYLRDNLGVDTDTVPTYLHEFEDGRNSVWPKAYPNQFLPVFREHFAKVWLPKKALEYFQDKDPAAIPYLNQVLTLPGAETAKKLPAPSSTKKNPK